MRSEKTSRRRLKIILLLVALTVTTVTGLVCLRGHLHRRYIYTRLMKLEHANPYDVVELHDEIVAAATPDDIEWAMDLFGKEHWRVDTTIMHMVGAAKAANYLPWLLSLLKDEIPQIRMGAAETIIAMIEKSYLDPSMPLGELSAIEKAVTNLVVDGDEDVRDLVMNLIHRLGREKVELLTGLALMDGHALVRKHGKWATGEFCDKYGFKDCPQLNHTDTRKLAGWFLAKWKLVRHKLPEQLLPEGLTEEMVLSRLAEFATSPDPPTR